MCTVTFVPLGDKDFIFSSNRDESPMRKAQAPEFHTYKSKLLLYPKDLSSGGTWIGLNQDQRLVCVLNGGFEAHRRKANYKKSRGIVAKDVLIAEDLKACIDVYDFNEIEPFTMVIVESQISLQCFELVWDGTHKYFKALDNTPKIWSSSTLYDKRMREERENWFKDHLESNTADMYSMYVFHTSAGQDNSEYGVIMDRNFVKTTSITRIERRNEEVIMRYYDLNNNKHFHKYLNPNHEDLNV